MTLLQLIILALVQGITEFLPISSSGHLILIPEVVGWQDQGQIIDIAVHVGTLGAVMVYVRREISMMFEGVLGIFRQTNQRPKRNGLRLTGQVVIATLPVMGVGFLMHEYANNILRNLEVIAWTTFGFGLLLFAADRLGITTRRLEHMSWGGAILIGWAQILALIPGTSRSGITITVARFLGYGRLDAARFSMLLAIPAILGAGVLSGLDLYYSGNMELTYDAIIAMGFAFISAWLAITIMMMWLRRASFTPFVIYRILLGCSLLTVVYF